MGVVEGMVEGHVAMSGGIFLTVVMVGVFCKQGNGVYFVLVGQGLTWEMI